MSVRNSKVLLYSPNKVNIIWCRISNVYETSYTFLVVYNHHKRLYNLACIPNPLIHFQITAKIDFFYKMLVPQTTATYHQSKYDMDTRHTRFSRLIDFLRKIANNQMSSYLEEDTVQQTTLQTRALHSYWCREMQTTLANKCLTNTDVEMSDNLVGLEIMSDIDIEMSDNFRNENGPRKSQLFIQVWDQNQA